MNITNNTPERLVYINNCNTETTTEGSFGRWKVARALSTCARRARVFAEYIGLCQKQQTKGIFGRWEIVNAVREKQGYFSRFLEIFPIKMIHIDEKKYNESFAKAICDLFLKGEKDIDPVFLELMAEHLSRKKISQERLVDGRMVERILLDFFKTDEFRNYVPEVYAKKLKDTLLEHVIKYNDDDSRVRLAECILHGIGRDPNTSSALLTVQNVLRNNPNHKEALVLKALCAITMNSPQATCHAKKAAEKGHAAAMYKLAEYKKDHYQFTNRACDALKWYEAAAERGITKAKVDLVTFYMTGNCGFQSCDKNPKRARELSEELATHRVQSYSRKGIYGLKSYYASTGKSETASILEQLASSYNQRTYRDLMRILRTVLDIADFDKDKASLEDFRRNREQCLNLVNEGLLDIKSTTMHEAIAMFFWKKYAQECPEGNIEKASEMADKGNLDAQLFLADVYNQSGSRQEKVDTILKYYNNAANDGSIEAMYQLARLYDRNVNKPEFAYGYYEMAVKTGKGNDYKHAETMLSEKTYLTIRVLRRIEELKSNEDLLKLPQVLNDSSVKKWNTIKIGNTINQYEWQIVGVQILSLAETLFPDDDKGINQSKKKSINRFSTQLLQTRDAKDTKAQEHLKLRFKGIVDYAESLNLKDTKDIALAKELMDILEEGGGACPDRAIVGLDKAETFLKINADNTNYLVNVLVNEFKKNLIQAKLVSQDHVENLETYLYYLIKLNKYLGLECNGMSMLYQGHAEKIPLYRALDLTLNQINSPNLIGYISGRNEFRGMHKAEEQEMLKQCQIELNNLYESNEKEEISDEVLFGREQELLSKMTRLKETFYTDKARKLLEEKGYLRKSN